MKNLLVIFALALFTLSATNVSAQVAGEKSEPAKTEMKAADGKTKTAIATEEGAVAKTKCKKECKKACCKKGEATSEGAAGMKACCKSAHASGKDCCAKKGKSKKEDPAM